MRAIEERYKSYISTVDAGCFHPKNLGDTIRNTFISGAKSEREELTRWNSSQEYPELNKDVLIRYKWNKDDEKSLYTVGYVYKDESSDEIVWYTNDDILSFGLEFFWREIHEGKERDMSDMLITEDLLKRCGFVCYAGEDIATGTKYYQYERSEFCKYGVLCGKDGFWFGNGDSWFEKISYLHELRDLIRALAKETLVIDLQ